MTDIMGDTDARDRYDAGPRNLDAEQGLLGSVMFDNAVLRVIDPLDPRHFSEGLHARLWAHAITLAEAGKHFDAVILADRLKDDAGLAELGGLRYLFDLVDHAPSSISAPGLAGIIADLGLRRDLIRLGAEIAKAARSGDLSALEHMAEAESAISELSHGAAPSEVNLIDAHSSALETLAQIEIEAEHGRPKGLMTGLRCIDRRLRGLRPGHLVIIAGRPSMGKTALARQAAFGCATRNPSSQVAFFALEMHRRELDERTLSELSYDDGEGITYQDMSGDKLPPMERMRLKNLVWKVPKNLVIDDSPILTVEYVKRRVWALKRRGPVGAIFVDYLQIMDRPAANGRNDAAVIGDMTKALKQLARQAQIAVVLLSQVNRGVESRDDKRPQLSDLRESGAIEQDANAVLFPYREYYYLQRSEPAEASSDKHRKWAEDCEMVRRRLDVICAKNRQGAVGTDHQEYIAEFDVIRDTVEDRK